MAFAEVLLNWIRLGKLHDTNLPVVVKEGNASFIMVTGLVTKDEQPLVPIT